VRISRYSSASHSAGMKAFRGITLGSAGASARRWWASLFTVPVQGPLLARLELAAGGTDATQAKFVDGGWTAGVRLGVGAETPVGPVRFEYGLALRGRDALFVRLGRWF
jgi:outer membrane translocation and assembly module TamA